ncbi:MAG: hypothetical protein JWL79_2828 [Frankiales bacterium]|nr:hypothetical protein [Frankiales bacterium]
MTQTSNLKSTAAYQVQAAISFGAAMLFVGAGVAYLPIDRWMRAFLALGFLYLVSSCFTLAKVVRDAQESSAVLSRVDQARLEKLLAEHDPYAVPTL